MMPAMSCPTSDSVHWNSPPPLFHSLTGHLTCDLHLILKVPGAGSGHGLVRLFI